MAAASAVFGQRGKWDAALVLREEGERGEGVVELAGWFQAGQGREKKRGRSAGSARLRRGGLASNLGVRIGRWRRVEGPRYFGRNQGRGKAGGATRARHAAGGLGVRRRRRHWENREGDGVRANS